MTFRVTSLEIGYTTTYDCTTYDWENFTLSLVKIFPASYERRPQILKMQKVDGKWSCDNNLHSDMVKKLQEDIDNYFFCFGKTLYL